MKLIRTLIESTKGESDPVAPPRTPSRRPTTTAPRLRSSLPVSDASKARGVVSDGLDRRMKEFKADLLELAPQKIVEESGQKSKRVWNLDPAEAETDETKQDAQARQQGAKDKVTARPLPLEAPENATPVKQASTPPEKGRDCKANALEMCEVPAPPQPRQPLTAGRKKTRISGFCGDDARADLFDLPNDGAEQGLEFPVGWLVIIKGPGRGTSFVLQNPVSCIGRGAGQTITLNYGDNTISRQNHAAVAYDDKMNACFLGFGDKAKLVHLNGRPVLGTEQLTHGDIIRVGETDLKFIGLCGPDFSWQDKDTGRADD